MREESRKRSEEIAGLLEKVSILERENERNKQFYEDAFKKSLYLIKHSRTWLIGSVFVFPILLLRDFFSNPARFCRAPRRRFRSLADQHFPGDPGLEKAPGGNEVPDGARHAESPATGPVARPLVSFSGASHKVSETESAFSSSGVKERKSIRDIRVAAVVDEFTSACFSPEMRLLPLTLDNWEEIFEENEVDLLLVESAWSGFKSSWKGIIPYAGRTENAEILRALKDLAGRHGVPAVFWSKEDPPDYEVFRPAASFFDYIFTSDANMIPRYSRDLGRSQVYDLPFCAQPAIHNPEGKTEEPGKNLLFAGTWYKRHRDRFLDYERVLEPALNFPGFHIYDRMLDNPNSELYGFPEKYQSCIKGKLPYHSLLKEYKKYRIFLNVNSVQYSPTMFSRRVFEVLLSGTPVISGYSLGIERILGADTVRMVATPEEGREAISSLLENEEQRGLLRRRGIRRVMEGNTCEDRVKRIFDTVGIGYNREYNDLAVWTLVRNRDELESALDNFKRQSFKNARMRFYLVTPDASLCAAIRLPAQTRVLSLKGGGDIPEALDQVQRNSSEPYLAYLDASVWYGSFYLMDMGHALRYSRCRFAVKAGFIHFDGNRFVLEGEREAHRRLSNIECDLASAVYLRTLPVELRRAGRQWMITGRGLDMYSLDSQGMIKGKDAARLSGPELEALDRLDIWTG